MSGGGHVCDGASLSAVRRPDWKHIWLLRVPRDNVDIVDIVDIVDNIPVKYPLIIHPPPSLHTLLVTHRSLIHTHHTAGPKPTPENRNQRLVFVSSILFTIRPSDLPMNTLAHAYKTHSTHIHGLLVPLMCCVDSKLRCESSFFRNDHPSQIFLRNR